MNLKENVFKVCVLFLYFGYYEGNAATTLEYVERYGDYLIEEHKVTTTDEYILTMFRMQRKSSSIENKTSILLQHGFVLSSDIWVLPGKDIGLAFVLADAGYDVWLGNQRGNPYSRQHKTLSHHNAEFWDFSWHEIGLFDLPAMIEHILATTNLQQLHYIGFSQGTSALLVLLSQRPEFGLNFQTIHLLAPVAYMHNMQHPFTRFARLMLFVEETIFTRIGHRAVLDLTSSSIYQYFCSWICEEGALLQPACRYLYNLIGGPGIQHYDLSLYSDICLTHPAGASSKQFLHFLQVIVSNKFQLFDYGNTLNEQNYQQPEPPEYNLTNIVNCLNLYYSTGDYLSSAKDVEQLSSKLECVELHAVETKHWNHYDYLWSKQVKNIIYEKLLKNLV